MRKLFLLAGIALLSLNANAQEKESNGLEGTWWASCQVGYQKTEIGDAANTKTMILPIAGYFVSPSVTVGAAVGTIKVDSESDGIETNLFVVEPLARKYWNISGGFFFFGQLATPIVSGKVKDTDIKVSQFGVAASGGLDYVVNKWFTVELSYNLANLSFTKLENFGGAGVDVTTTDFSLAHIATVDSEYNSALGGAMNNAITPLSFGFKFLF